METKVQMQESPVQKANRRWEKKYNKVDKKVKESVLRVLVVTVLAFSLTFLMGTIIGLADPSGWAAWRVGLMFGGVTGLFVLVVGIIGTVIYLGEESF